MLIFAVFVCTGVSRICHLCLPSFKLNLIQKPESVGCLVNNNIKIASSGQPRNTHFQINLLVSFLLNKFSIERVVQSMSMQDWCTKVENVTIDNHW